MVVAGLGALVLLTGPWAFELLGGDARFRWFPGIGHYPKSLLGTDVEPISNAYPPTVCYAAVGIWTIGAAMLLRERVSRWLERPLWLLAPGLVLAGIVALLARFERPRTAPIMRSATDAEGVGDARPVQG